MLSNENLTQSMRELRDTVEARLDALVPPPHQGPADLHRAMRHTLLAPGKRSQAQVCELFPEGRRRGLLEASDARVAGWNAAVANEKAE